MADLTITLSDSALDVAALHAGIVASHGPVGAVASFTGMVRDQAHGEAVDHLYLDWYPGMTEASLQAIGEAAAARFSVAAVVIYHRCGKVAAGEAVVFVAAASAHRRAAFDAVDFLMDKLKSEAALWKRESGPDGERWIEPTAADGDALKRWSE